MIPLMAWRNIWRNKARSIVIMLSVAIGLLAGIGVLALYKGMMTSRVRTVIDSEVAHLQFIIRVGRMKNTRRMCCPLPMHCWKKSAPFLL